MNDFSVHAWFEEIFEQQVGQKFLIKDYLYSAKSEFQKIDIFDTYSHGKLLAHDGMVMIIERDEFIIDSSDPVGPAAPLFDSAFYRDVEKCLFADGIVCLLRKSGMF